MTPGERFTVSGGDVALVQCGLCGSTGLNADLVKAAEEAWETCRCSDRPQWIDLLRDMGEIDE